MTDPRVTRQAQILVEHSTKPRPGETAMIFAYSELGKPLVVELYRQLLKRDLQEIFVLFQMEELIEAQVREAPAEYLLRTPSLEMYLTEHIDVWYGIHAPLNTRYLTSAPPGRVGDYLKQRRPIVTHRVEHARWVLTKFPTEAAAQDADMSLEEYEEFVFRATDIDWEAVARQQQKLKELFESGREVRILGEDTDLRLRVDGRTFISAHGELNMPDGEIFTSPLEDSVQGHIHFTYPAIYQGREADHVRLWFEKGRIEKAIASKGQDYLEALLNTDSGARYIGELGIGNNFAIQRFVKDILFDEKIGGTIHLAVGESYAIAGGENKSAIHWDMIKDLRNGGEIYLDGELVQKDGRWLMD